MTFVPAKTTPCPVPPDFDQDAYRAVSARVSRYSDAPAWSSYAGGMNGLVFRFAATDEAHDALSESLSGPRALSPSGPRYAQEAALFSFYSNSVSALECLYFATYNLGACLGVAGFRVATDDDLRRITIGTTVKAFNSAFPKEGLTKHLERVATSRQMSALKEYRDFLAHRGTAPRKHVVEMGPDRRVNMSGVVSATITSNPKTVPSSWMSTLELTPSMTSAPRAWLGITVSEILHALDKFLKVHVTSA